MEIASPRFSVIADSLNITKVPIVEKSATELQRKLSASAAAANIGALQRAGRPARNVLTLHPSQPEAVLHPKLIDFQGNRYARI